MRRGHLRQLLHVLYEIAFQVVSLFSRVLNGLTGGSMYQTFSARTHMEAKDNPDWIKIEKRIDLLFRILTLGYQKDHCRRARQSEVDRAIKTLIRNGNIL